MPESLKKQLFNKYVDALMVECPTITEAQCRKVADKFSIGTLDTIQKITEVNVNMYQTAMMDMEVHRTKFKSHVEFLEKNTKLLLDAYKQSGMITYERDRSGKLVLKARSTVLANTVSFLNHLEEMVIEYYKEVFKVERQEDIGKPPTLF